MKALLHIHHSDFVACDLGDETPYSEYRWELGRKPERGGDRTTKMKK